MKKTLSTFSACTQLTHGTGAVSDSTTISGVYHISEYGLLALFPKYAACLIGNYRIVGYKDLHKAIIPCRIALKRYIVRKECRRARVVEIGMAGV
jgi:hypothetical protein